MVPQASEKCGLLLPDQRRITSCTSNNLTSKQVAGTFFALTISSLALQLSAQSKHGSGHPFHPWCRHEHK